MREHATAQERSVQRSRLLSPQQVADVLGVSASTSLRLITSGQLPCIVLRAGKQRKLYRVREQALEQWIVRKERVGVRASAATTTAPDDGNCSREVPRSPATVLNPALASENAQAAKDKN